MSNCQTCAHFTYQALIHKRLADGLIFKGTPMQQEGYTKEFPLYGCARTGVIWPLKSSRFRKPRGIDCKYKEKE